MCIDLHWWPTSPNDIIALYMFADYSTMMPLIASSLRLWDVSDAKKHLQVIKAKDKQGKVSAVHAMEQYTSCYLC